MRKTALLLAAMLLLLAGGTAWGQDGPAGMEETLADGARRANSLFHEGRYEQSLAVVTDVLPLARENGYYFVEVTLHTLAAQNHYQQGNPEAAYQEQLQVHQITLRPNFLQRARTECGDCDIEGTLATIYAMMAQYCSQQGMAGEARRWAQEGTAWLNRSCSKDELAYEQVFMRGILQTDTMPASQPTSMPQPSPTTGSPTSSTLSASPSPIAADTIATIRRDTIVAPNPQTVPIRQHYRWALPLLGLLLLGFMVYMLVQRRRIARETERQRSKSFLDGQEQERQRLARELHDGVSNQLLAVEMRLNADDSSSEQVKRLLSESREQVRRVSHGLMPPAFQHTTLCEALNTYLCEIDGTGGCSISLQVSPPEADWSLISANKALEVYRIVQEAVGNALKHSGATLIAVGVQLSRQLTVTIADNGRFVPPAAQGNGIGTQTMQQRARAIGATLQIRPSPYGGVVRVDCPI